MMESLLHNLTFPDRNLFKRVDLVAVYVEPRVGSGERICVGVVGVQEGTVESAEVANLNRLRCLFRDAHIGLIVAGRLALASLSDHVRQVGFKAAVQTWIPPAQGLFLGTPTTTAASSLADALRVSLGQFSSLHTESASEDKQSTL